MEKLVLALLAALLLVPASMASAQWHDDRVTFGSDVVIAEDEVVYDLVTMGGDAVVEGTVLGDVLTMGGNLEIRSTAEVHGDVMTMGGDLDVAHGANVLGDIGALGGDITGADFGGDVLTVGGELQGAEAGGVAGWFADAFSGLVSYGLLFVLGLLLMGLGRERFEALQVVILRKPARVTALGILGFVGSIVAIIVLAITIIGIPAALLLAMVLPLAIYVGMAASASIVGAALPVERLRKRPVLQLAAGVFALWLASLVPVFGSIVVGIAAVIGLGALFETRFKKTVHLGPGPEPTQAGPYRTHSA